MKTSQRKAKGRSFVLEIKEWLHRTFPWTVDHDVIVPATSAGGEDLVLSPQLRAVFPYSLEMKRQEGLSKIYDFMKQAQNNSKGHTPIVICRSNRQPPLVIMTLEDWSKKWQQ